MNTYRVRKKVNQWLKLVLSRRLEQVDFAVLLGTLYIHLSSEQEPSQDIMIPNMYYKTMKWS